MFYETKADLLNVLTAYFRAGIECNEYCVWVISDPITPDDAREALRHGIPSFDSEHASKIQIVPAREWYLQDAGLESHRVIAGWREKLKMARIEGYDGLRVSGNAFWMGSGLWKNFTEYEKELDRSLHGQAMIVLCTYSLQASRAVELLDVARAHQFAVTRRHVEWELLETPELEQARQEIKLLNEALNVLSNPFPEHERLTERERLVLAQIVKGATSKEAARMLKISPRTVEFHRANIMQKFGARNTADLVAIVLGQNESDLS